MQNGTWRWQCKIWQHEMAGRMVDGKKDDSIRECNARKQEKMAARDSSTREKGEMVMRDSSAHKTSRRDLMVTLDIICFV